MSTNVRGWIVSIETTGSDGWGWYYLDANGDPYATEREQAHVWPDRQAALRQAERWEQARLVWRYDGEGPNAKEFLVER
jgi:hypothetical protein